MKLRSLLSDPLLLKELAAQSRRRVRAGLTYPNLLWFLLVTHLPPVLYWKLGGAAQDLDLRLYFSLSVLLQVWLIALRSTLYPSVSMASEVREGTIPVLLSTPLSLARALVSKLIACLLPLWLEILMAQPLYFGFYVWAGGLDVTTVLAVDGFLLAVSLVFGCLGLWLGTQFPEPERAAANARMMVGMLLIGTLLLEKALTWPLLVVGSVVWVCLVFSPSRPGASYQGLVYALVLVFSLPLLLNLAQGVLYNFELSAFNPLKCVYTLAVNEPPNHLVPDLVEQARVQNPPGGTLEGTLRQLKAGFPVEETHRRAVAHLIPTALIYLLLAAGMFRLALGRVRNLP